MKNFILGILTVFALSQVSIATGITADIAAKNINIAAGKSFTIKLPSNPTTGYNWNMKCKEKNKITLEAYEYHPSRSNLTGSGGVEQWRFKAVQKGKAIVHFSYARPWEKNIPPVDHKVFNVMIK